MYQFFVGCDVSKAVIDVSYHNGSKPTYLGQIKNNNKGFKKLLTDLKKITDLPCSSWMVCFENTGVYSKALLEWLFSLQIACKEESGLQIAKSIGIRRGKNDKVDSLAICQYVFEKKATIEVSKLPKPLIIKLKKLLSRRDLLVRSKQSFSVSLQDQARAMDPNLYKIFIKGNKELIEHFNREIDKINLLIKQTIKADKEFENNYDLLLSIKGIGPVIAAYMIAVTNNFTTFKNARKFASYSGIAPFLVKQSGIKKGTMRVSHIANKKIKSLLSNGIAAAIRFDPEMALYYARKIDQGKAKGVALNNAKNKLVHRAFAVVKRQTPYVQLANYR